MDITPFKCIAESSGRETFITDGSFNLLWTNSDRQILQILQGSDLNSIKKPIRKEICLKCSDGRALKLTPVINNNKAELYIFELYDANELLSMLMATPVLEKYRNKFKMMRDTIGKYLDNAAESIQAMDTEDIDSIRAISANRLAFLNTLADESEKRSSDIGIYLKKTVLGYIGRLAERSGQFDFDTEISTGLYSTVALSSLEYAVINMFTNAFLHSVPEKKKQICIRAYKKDSMIVIETEDNGTDADLKKIETYRSISSPDIPDNENECIGISLLEMFAVKYGGSLEFELNETGGLITRILLPCTEYSDVFDLGAPCDNYLAKSLCFDILKNIFNTIDPSDFRELSEASSYLI